MRAPFDLERIGTGLPFATARGDLEVGFAQGTCVVQAPPGSGKTTVAPPTLANWLLDQGRPGRVLVTQPRRIAARTAAHRLAQLSGTTVGKAVGYSVRGESRVSASTAVEFVTPGLLVRRLLDDPELEGVAAVILDEVHERSIDSDLLVGMLGEVRMLREDLPLVAMSATLDATTFADLLGSNWPAPLIDCPTALHPLDVHWAPGPARTDERGTSREFCEHITTQTVHALDLAEASPEPPLVKADALVFLPSVIDVDNVAERLRLALPEAEVLTLHGRMTPSEQDEVLSPGEPGQPRRVVVSTALAESSLTVPGVQIVVDSGLAREPRLDVGRGMSGLVTVACSRAAAQQRAGRAGRLGPGLVVRCYDEATYARMPEHVTPEITTADLTATALTLAAWGTPRGDGLALPTPPPRAAITTAEVTLHSLGAIDEDGRITDLGKRLVRVPTDPRLARALLEGAQVIAATEAAEIVAALGDDLRSATADTATAIRELRGPAKKRWERETHRLARLVSSSPALPSRGKDLAAVPVEHPEGLVIALAHPERVARRVSDGVYLLASGTRAALPPQAILGHHEWLAVAELARANGPIARGTGAVIRLASPLNRDLAETAAAHLLADEVRTTWQDGKVTARRVQALGAIEFSSSPTRPTHTAARKAVLDALSTAGPGLLTWSEAAQTLRNRLAFLHHHLGAPWPAVDDASLVTRLDEWLGPELDALADGARTTGIDLAEPLRRLLPWPEATRFDELAPARLRVPSGSQIPLTYPTHDEAGAAPTVAVKLQECFGLDQTPTLADGRCRVVFHLLSPARHPVAVTDDLVSFWSGPYKSVRAQMRGRYPKHPWPEDPWTHPATARTKKRM